MISLESLYIRYCTLMQLGLFDAECKITICPSCLGNIESELTRSPDYIYKLVGFTVIPVINPKACMLHEGRVHEVTVNG